MDINKIADQIAAEEKFESRVYIDTQGFATIGYGRKLSDKKYPRNKEGLAQARKDFNDPVETKEKARADMIEYIENTAIPDAQNFMQGSFDNLASKTQESIVSLAYNVGGKGINQFSSLRSSLQNNDLKGAAQSLMGSLAGVQALFRYAEIVEKSFGKENMPSLEELKANPRAAELLNFIHGRKVLGKPIPKAFERYIDNERIKGATVIDFLPQELQDIYNSNGGGTEGSKAVQKYIGVKADGVIGAGTLRKALEDERRSKAGSYSKEELEDDKVSFSVSEEQKEESFIDRSIQGIKDFGSDVFEAIIGSAAASDEIPPMENLKQPQEEMPMMSPTDAMRARSQGRVVLDSQKSVPTNPEAGPSDTVPAMLTPGEAVIPASAAQDPENKPIINALINEGRAKNRAAEANGVPVNSKEATLYDDAELDAYHKRNKTGKYGGGEMSLQGFAGGTMHVPAIMMMAPPAPEKDPTMDAMEKMALKQAAYEQKSKNRTRDTVEKIGLKHLEETASAEMKQAALDETMRNYGLTVPAPMSAPPVQGFSNGKDYVIGQSYVGENPSEAQLASDAIAQNPSLTPDELVKEVEMRKIESQGVGVDTAMITPENQTAGQSLDVRRREQEIAMPAAGQAFKDQVDSMDQSQLLEYMQFGAPSPEHEAYARNRYNQLMSGAQAEGPVPPMEGNQIKIAGEDGATITATSDEPQVDTPEDAGDPPDDENGFGKAVGAFFSAIGSSLAETAKQVFDPTSIGRAAMTFTTLRLMGMPARASGQYAMNAYQTGQRQFQEKIQQDALTARKKLETNKALATKSAENYNKLKTNVTKQLTDIMGEKELEETAAQLGVTVDVLASSLITNLQNRGYNDLSSAETLGQVTDIANIAISTFRNDLRKGVVSNDLGAVLDRSLTSVVELGDAFADVTPQIQNTLFTGIRRNIPKKLKGMEGTEELRSRVSDIYQYYKGNPDKIAALKLRAPGVGENEFTVFLEAVLAQGGIRTVV